MTQVQNLTTVQSTPSQTVSSKQPN